MSPSDGHSSSLGGSSPTIEPAWDAIAERLDAFSATWAVALEVQGEPPAIRDFLGNLADGDAAVLAVELVKLDLEHRWQHGREPRKLEPYLADVPELGPADQLPVELIYEEVQARVQAGDGVDDLEIRRRFPRQADAVCNLLGGMSAPGSPTNTYYNDTVVASGKERRERPSGPPLGELKPGDVIDDFHLITPLGSGAFAKVYLARQQSMERLVALKISRHVGSEPQTLAQLDHPHVVRVYDQRSSVDPPARLLYMEVVPGGTLQDALSRVRDSYDGRPAGDMMLTAIDARLAAAGSLPPSSSERRTWFADSPWADVVCKLGAELAEGLAYAHSRGVLHRDIKPANVLLTADGTPKLADFNVSYNGGRADEDPTDTFGGSLAYMSPEQLEACHPLLGGSPHQVREPSDVYSLGVLLWEMLVGRRPFADEAIPGGGGTLARLQRMIDSRRGVDLNQLAATLPADCPAALRQTLQKALAPDVAERYASARELGQALQLCLNKRCWKLLQPPTSLVGRIALAWPIVTVVLAGLIPNALVAAFNYHYNLLRLSDPDLEISHPEINDVHSALMKTFDAVQLWVNGLAFPIGIGVGAWFAWKTLRMLRPDAPRSASVGCSQLLMFGGFVSKMLLVIWAISGAVFPIALAWEYADLRDAEFQIHFFVSLALAGFAAIAYPYLMITALVVRYFVPDQMRRGVIAGPRKSTLARVGRLNRFHLALSALVPLLGVLLIVLYGKQYDWLLKAVSGGGLVAFAAMFFLEREIDLDMQALAHVAVDDRANAAWIQSVEDSQDLARSSAAAAGLRQSDVRLASGQTPSSRSS
ncbi:MAG: serine/threonine protein kinase [Pirellulales bacterium]|nr:serine/threonine protein kinase [Pirellulales bacterium]